VGGKSPLEQNYNIQHPLTLPYSFTMVFKSPYPLTVPDVDYLTYLFTSTIFSPNEKVWIEANDPSNFITQSRALELTQRIGAGLQSIGITRPVSGTAEQDIVLFISENQIMTPVTMFGIINSGAIVSTIPPQASSFEIAKQITSTEAKLLICSPSILKTAQEGVAKSTLSGMPIAVMSSADGKQELNLLDGESLISHNKLPLEAITDRNILEKRVILLGFSSGTTGVPKGFPLLRAC
jgi:4-coumarate--CoA ligase